MTPFRLLFCYRRALYATTLVEVRARYIGTALGLGWAVVYPYLFLGVYGTVFAFILQVRLKQYTPFEYLLIMFAGLIPFIGFSEALGASVNSVVGNKHLIKNTLFPIDLVPVKAVLASSLSMIIGLVGLIVAAWADGQFFGTQLLIVPLLVLQLIFSVGIGWALSALTVFFRDISQTIGIVTLFLMIISPIGYTKDMIPPELVLLAYCNPLFYIIELYRQILIFDQIVPRYWLSFGIISFGAFAIGFVMFQRLKPVFSEYV